MNEIMYFDAAATMQKPQSVINAESDFLSHKYANAGRGICPRAAVVDDMVVAARRRVAAFINADENNIVFTAGATDGLNRVVRLVGAGHKTVAVSDLDHHSARLPWQMRPDTDVVVWELDGIYNLDLSRVPWADVYVITVMSNVIGVALDIKKTIRAVRAINPNAVIVVDAAQYVVHDTIDAETWGADFICFSGHKIGADTGIGIMYIKNPDRWTPDKFGGGMVLRVDADDIVLNAPPYRFEAGTLPLTQIAGLTSAIDWIENNRPSRDLIQYLYDELSVMPRIELISPRESVLVDFIVRDMHVLDFGAMMGAHGVCLRVGNMCASWLHKKLGIDGSVRISVDAHNTMAQVRCLAQIIKDVVK